MAVHVITGKKAYGLAMRKRPIPHKKIREIIGTIVISYAFISHCCQRHLLGKES